MNPIRLTPARHAWLVRLAEEGPQERDHTTVGFYCHQAGWCEWNYRDGNEDITGDEARARHGDRWWEHVKSAGERITEYGREVLQR